MSDNKPLYKILDEQRTHGIVKVTTEGYLGYYELEFPDTTNLCTLPKVNDNTRYFANAEYTALAVNNLHHLAEALELCIDEFESFHDAKDVNSTTFKLISKAKEALNLIS